MATVAADEARKVLDSTPAELFSGDEAAIRHQFKTLALRWHPDTCKDPQAERVFKYIQVCRDAALGKSTAIRRKFVRRAPEKGAVQVDYLLSSPLAYGEMLVTQTNVVYVLPESLSALVEPVYNRQWKFLDPKIEKEMSPRLPHATVRLRTEGGYLLSYRRTRDQVLLRHLIDFERGRGNSRVDPLDVMWIVSNLLNLCCYLEIHREAHCALTPDYLLLDLDDHSVSLTGPALFAVPLGERPKSVPTEVLEAFPRLRSKTYKVEDSTLDLTMVRSLTAKMLGHSNVALMRRDDTIPEGLRQWVSSPPPSSALKDYAAWEKARGKRAFHRYGATAREIYDSLRT